MRGKRKWGGVTVLFNDVNTEYNHYNVLTQYSELADKFIIVSPFLTSDMPRMLSGMPTIKCVELYTNLDGYGMAVNVLPAIRGLYEYCHDMGVSVSVKYNNHLHGKAYLLYKGNEGKGCIITSGNFTDNGMKNNHEYGVFLDNDSLQAEIREQIYGLDCLELSYEEVVELTEKAYEFTDKHSAAKLPVFKAADYIKNRVILPDNCNFFVKPLGNENRPVGEGYTIIEDNDIGFSKKTPGISKGDILICYGVKVHNVLGCCRVLTGEAKEGMAFEGDRWKFKLTTGCISEKYSSHWWDYDIKIFDLVDAFIKIKKEGEHVTAAGKDKLDALQYGHQYIKITKEFAQFIVDIISNI